MLSTKAGTSNTRRSRKTSSGQPPQFRFPLVSYHFRHIEDFYIRLLPVLPQVYSSLQWKFLADKLFADAPQLLCRNRIRSPTLRLNNLTVFHIDSFAILVRWGQLGV